MDLIYTNPDREDLGVLFDYEFDLAFGSSENNFECKVQMDNHCMESGSFLYIEGTEYGGIVDSVAVDTENKTVTYSGRTWHGILAGNVIEPGKEVIETIVEETVEVPNPNIRLPEGYKELEYIESTGTQYIDTGVKPTGNTKMVLDIAMLADLTTKNMNGVRNSSADSTNRFGVVVFTSNNEFGAYFGTCAVHCNATDTERHLFVLSADECTVDGVSYGTPGQQSFSCSYTLPFLSWSNGSDGQVPISGRLYGGELHSTGILTRDFVPCVNPAGEVGAYDLVEAVFHGNAGSGEFIAGPEVVYDPIQNVVQKVITSEVKYDYHVVNGEANTVIRDLIEYLDLSNIFTADEAESGILVKNYHFERYTEAYKGIRKMLAEFGGKLKLTYKRDTVILSAVPLVDYSLDEEFDASQVDFQVKKNFRPVNHLICLGSGNLKDRHIIHLFADEYGGIQPYKTTENPVCDGDYILDKSQQVLFGVEEVADVYDYSSAQTTENYIRLEEQPDDWATKYADYFTQDETSGYKNVEGVPEDVYTALTEEPSDWAKKFASYFYMTEEGKFKTVEAVTTDTYIKQTAKPADWENNYANYFTYFTDGVEDYWNPVQADKATRYLPQTKQPSDWATNYKNYFDSPWGSPVDPDYNKKEQEIPPSWEPKRFYTAEDYDVAPEWKSGTYYTLNSTTGAPDFVPGSFYSMQTIIVNPPFAKKKYFRKEFDHFKEMLVGALDKMQEFFNCDSVSIDLDLEGVYDIGDIVGATEHETGVAVWQPITKKIVSISNNQESINYEIGVIQYG